MSVVQICGVGVIVLLAVMLLKNSNARFPEIVILIFGGIVFLRSIGTISDVIEFVEEFSSGTSVSVYIKILLKAVGIAYLVDFTSALCRDSGEGGIASYVELAGRCEILLLTLPIAKELLEISFGLLNL